MVKTGLTMVTFTFLYLYLILLIFFTNYFCFIMGARLVDFNFSVAVVNNDISVVAY